MPKLKTRRAAAKRFRITGSGKFMRRHAFHNHLLDHKSPKRKRFLGTMAVVDETDHDRVSLMLPLRQPIAGCFIFYSYLHLFLNHGPR
jgi:large subunit ribosomal protein L35